MKNIYIGTLAVGENHPAVIIAEIACQHGGDIAVAKKLARVARDAGADVVKSQLHIPEEEMVPGSITFWGGSMDDILRSSNLRTYEQHRELKEYCESIGVLYLCTPFSKGASDILEKVGVRAYKTGSGELTNLPMLRHIARKGKPMIVSTGMSTEGEIDDAVAVIQEEGAPLALMHCLSEYPPEYRNMNLRMIQRLRERYQVPVGLSDHSTNMQSALAGVALGACVIEKHFSLPDTSGPDDVVSLMPEEFAEMVEAIRNMEQALSGDRRELSESEKTVRAWAHHSVVTVCDIAAGEKLARENVTAKRPGSGISARYLDARYASELLGKKAKRDLPQNTILTWDDIT